MWHMHFDGASSNEGNGIGITLHTTFGKSHSFAYRLNFACTNNVAEFEALLLGLENALALNCKNLTFW
jgi:ribonuclease HI